MTAPTTAWTTLLDVLFDDPGVGRCLVAPDGTILRANAEWLRSAGLGADDAIGADAIALSPEARDTALAMHARARAGHRVDVPRRAQRIGGRETFWEGSIAPIPMEGGTGLLITAREVAGAPAPPIGDVMDRARAEEALRAENEKYRSLFHHSVDAVYLTTPDGAILDANRAACELHGMSLEELRRAGRAGVVVNDERHAAALALRARTGEVRAELTARRKDGTTVPVEVQSVLVEPARPDSPAFVISRDVSVRRRQEEALRAAMAELEESEDRFRAVFEAASDAVLLVDPGGEGRVVMANPAACRMFGYTVEEFRSVDRARSLDASDPRVARFLAVRRDAPQAGPVELTCVRKDGTRFTGEITSSVFHTRAGELRSVLIVRDVTERERAADALALSEAVLAQAGAMAHLGAWWIDASARPDDLNASPLRWSSEVYRIFGYEPGEVDVSNELFFRHVHPDDRPRVSEAVARAIAEHGRYVLEHRIHRRDGEERVVLEHGEGRYDEAGQLVRFVGAVQDITVRKRREEALRASEGRLRRLYDSGMIGVLEFDLDGAIHDANDAFLSMVGYSRADLAQGRIGWDRMTPPEYAPLDARAVGELKSRGVDTPYEKEYVRKDGTRVPIIIGGAMYDDERHRGISFVLDVTDRKRAAEAVRESEERYRTLFTHMTEGFALGEAICDEEGAPRDFRFLEMNEAFEHQSGLARDQARGRPMREVLPRIEQSWIDTYCGVALGAPPRRFESYNRDLDRHFSVYCFSPARGRFAIIFTDVTDRKRAEESVRAANERLRDADRRKDEFLGMLSHELRNPLAPIRNALYILDRAEPTGQQARRAKDVANRQVAHLTRLVDDLLDVTRIARGKIELRRADLDLAALARRTAEDYRALMHERGLELAVEVPDAPLVVNGDDTRLAQVLGNLLSNAAKFTPAGGRVSLSIHARDGRASVRVRDTGPGIAPDVLPTIFEPFTQAKQTLARSEGGLGLGLALVKALVALHGGDVEVSSAGGGGTEFVVTLPLAAVPGAARERGGERDVAAASPRRRVLVVDDNADAAESLADLVRLHGHDVEVAHDGPAALEAARARRPDLVLCDLGLPGMDGYEVARRLRAADPALRLVAVSGYAQPEDVARAAEAGFDAHVAKPPDPAKLPALLR